MKNILGNNQRNYGELINAEDLIKSVENYEIPKAKKVPRSKAKKSNQSPVSSNIDFGKMSEESFIMSYDCPTNKEFYQELITKVNEVYKGTKAEIPTGTSGEVQGNLIKRMGIISTIANDSNLRSYGLFPITPAQSEYLLKNGKLTNPGDNWEDFGMVFYDLSESGSNPKEAKAIYESLKKHRTELGLSESGLEGRLIIANPGSVVDSSMPHGVKPIIIPGITQVYSHDILNETGKNHKFKEGLKGGLPTKSEIGEGSRTIYMPNETSNIGVRLLCRDGSLNLGAWYDGLADSSSVGRVNFARSAST